MATPTTKHLRLDKKGEGDDGEGQEEGGEVTSANEAGGTRGGGEDTGNEEDEEEEEEEEEEEDEGVREQMKEFFSELDFDLSRQKRSLMTEGLRVPKRRSVLPSHLTSVMGSANLRLARGDAAGAIELCLEVIRQAPHSPEPYLTLATVYEETGDNQKLLQILVISAHLRKTDVELWGKAGQLAAELCNFSLASRCYQQASRLEPTNLMLMWRKASIFQMLKETSKAENTYKQLLQLLPSQNNSHEIIEISKELAQLYYNQSNDANKAIEVLHSAVQSHMVAADDEAIHLLAELYITTKNYLSAFQLLETYYSMVPEQPNMSHDLPEAPPTDSGTFQEMLSSAIRVSLTGEVGEEGEEVVRGEREEVEEEEQEKVVREESDLTIPDDLPVDMRVKLAVCMIHLSLPLPPTLLAPIIPLPDEYGDLFLDLAEAYSETNIPSQALPLLSALVQTSLYNQPGVWLKHAECLHTLQDLEGAAVSYSHVLTLAPHHTDTRLALATIYVQLGRVEDALALLESEGGEQLSVSMETTEESTEREVEDWTRPPHGLTEYTLEELKVLHQRYKVLVTSNRVNGYVTDGISLLTLLFRDVYHRKDLRSIMHLGAKSLAEKKIKAAVMADSLLSLSEWWTVFVTVCKGLLVMGEVYHKKVIHLILCAATLNTFSVPDTELKFTLLASSLCCMLKEYDLAFTFTKAVCIKYNHPMLWNILNSLPLVKGYQKHILRLCFKHSSNLTLLRIHANYSLATNNYRFALSLYGQSHHQLSPNYLTCLSMACLFLDMASQKGAMSRNQLVLQGMGFLHKYLRLRGRCQESMYNVGRAFHQIGVVHAACHFYRQVLALEPENNDVKWREASDLRPEAAFNLSLIYQSSGNRTLAVQTLRHHCTT